MSLLNSDQENEEREIRTPEVPPSRSESVSIGRGSAQFNIDDFQCPVCLETIIDIIESDCHHRFCNYCLQQWFHTRGNRYCPVCRANIITVEVLEDVNANLEVQLTQRFTPHQLDERHCTRRLRNLDLSRRTFPIEGEPEASSAYRRMQEEFFPGTMEDDDETWQLDADLEEAIINSGLTFSRVVESTRRTRELFGARIDHGMGTPAMGRLREPSPSNPPPILSYRRHSSGGFSPRSRRAHAFYEPMIDTFMDSSEDSDSDDRILRRSNRLSSLISMSETNSHLNSESNQLHRNSESSEDLRSLRETIRHAEETVSTSSDPASERQEEDEPYTVYVSQLSDRNWESPSSNSRFRAMTPDQESLLAEFHFRFHQTELAFEAAATAQSHLDLEGNSLRQIYDQIVSEGLLDRDSQVSSARSHEFNNSHFEANSSNNAHYPSYTEFLQHSFHQGVHQFNPGFAAVPSPYYQTVWSTYLNNYNSNYHPEVAIEQSHTWYQRCLNSHGPPPPLSSQPPQCFCHHAYTEPIRQRNPLNFARQNMSLSNFNSISNNHQSPARMRRQAETNIDINFIEHFCQLHRVEARRSVSENLPNDLTFGENLSLQEAVRRTIFESDGGESEGDDLILLEEFRECEIADDAEVVQTRQQGDCRQEFSADEGSDPEREVNIEVEIEFQRGNRYH